MRENVKIGKINALKIAALIGVGLISTTQVQAIEDYANPYGVGANAIYYIEKAEANGYNSLIETNQSEGALITVLYDNSSTRIDTNLNGADLNNIQFVNTFYDKADAQNNLQGGSLFNPYELGSIGNISGIFAGNSAVNIQPKVNAYGGAIYNGGTINNISADFINNNVTADNESYGGAIFNRAGHKIADISGDFLYNSAISESTLAIGGAINNYRASIDNIGNDSNPAIFSNNVAYAKTTNARGGAIENYAYSNKDAVIKNINAKFINNVAVGKGFARGGAIENVANSATASIGDITAEFIQNKAIAGSSTARGGAITNYNYWEPGVASIGDIKANFVENSATSETGDSTGGAIYNSLGVIGKTDANGNVVGGFINSSFINNYAKSGSATAKGGAIWTNSDLNFISDNGTTEFTGNYTDSAGVKDDNAIWADVDTLTLNFDVKNSGKTILNDNIDGVAGYNVNITGDNSGTFYLYNDIRNARVSFGGTTINTVNNQVSVNHFNSLTIAANTDFVADVDLANQTMDRFTADSYGVHSGDLNVSGLNLLSDAANDTTKILFAENGLKDNVTTTISEVAYSPIYKYTVSYDKSEQEGYFVFNRASASSGSGTGGGSSSAGGFNPAVLGSSTGATVGALGTMNQTFNYGFQHSTDYMNIPYLERISLRDRNKYALAGGDLTEAGRFSPLYTPRGENSSVWVKPYATFESVDLKNGPKVSNISYGTLIGFDTELESINGGWDRVFTGYIGYNGASQRYLGTDTYQNGGLLGGTMTLYKGNFFNATTLSVGASVANNQTMYGNDNYTMLLGGIGNKAGYNFEFNEGKLILQPSMMMSYTFVNTFDYTNAAGVRIDNDPLHAIQLSPGLKVIGNLNDGWQPYASVNMVWNLMGKSDAAANGVRLPQMSIKPYVQYGVGVQKRFKHHFMAYGQAMMFNGGRNGICLSAGMRWDIGCKCHNKEKVENSSAVKKVVKAKNPNKISYLGE